MDIEKVRAALIKVRDAESVTTRKAALALVAPVARDAWAPLHDWCGRIVTQLNPGVYEPLKPWFTALDRTIDQLTEAADYLKEVDKEELADSIAFFQTSAGDLLDHLGTLVPS